MARKAWSQSDWIISTIRFTNNYLFYSSECPRLCTAYHEVTTKVGLGIKEELEKMHGITEVWGHHKDRKDQGTYRPRLLMPCILSFIFVAP
jgi:hypothetical protein